MILMVVLLLLYPLEYYAYSCCGNIALIITALYVAWGEFYQLAHFQFLPLWDITFITSVTVYVMMACSADT